MFRMRNLLVVIAVLAISQGVFAQTFAESVGSIRVGEVTSISPIRVPFILWGGDMFTFYANGGSLKTQPGSIFAKLGLSIELVPGDDPRAQAREYMEGKSPFFRGTFGMIGETSELFGSDPRTKPVMLYQLTWSTGGDHCVARAEIKTISDLKGKKIVIQADGPHAVGFLDDILATAGLTRDDVTLIWAKDLTGTPNSPVEMFKKDSSIAACFVVTPDMVSLTGGLFGVGSGAEGTVKGAHVLVSSKDLNFSIADVYDCRKDFWDKHSDIATKFVAGYLKACEEVIELKKAYESGGSKEYVAKVLQPAQNIWGKEAIPTLEDAHGLLSDCTPVGHPGNVTFFTQKNNPHGFEVMQKQILDIVTSRGYAKIRQGIISSPIDWNSSAFDFLTMKEVKKVERFKAEAVTEEIEALTAGGALDERTILSFSINFKANQTDFPEEQYGIEYQRIIDITGKSSNAAIAVRGHADLTKVLLEVIQAGMKKGIIQRSGVPGNYSYSINGRPLDLSSTSTIIKLIESGEFDGVADHNSREFMQAALNLSRERAEAVRDSIIKFAKSKGIEIDKTQIQVFGVGIKEPFIAVPKNMPEAEQNMRVEFRLVRVTPEVTNPSDFSYL